VGVGGADTDRYVIQDGGVYYLRDSNNKKKYYVYIIRDTQSCKNGNVVIARRYNEFKQLNEILKTHKKPFVGKFPSSYTVVRSPADLYKERKEAFKEILSHIDTLLSSSDTPQELTQYIRDFLKWEPKCESLSNRVRIQDLQIDGDNDVPHSTINIPIFTGVDDNTGAAVEDTGHTLQITANIDPTDFKKLLHSWKYDPSRYDVIYPVPLSDEADPSSFDIHISDNTVRRGQLYVYENRIWCVYNSDNSVQTSMYGQKCSSCERPLHAMNELHTGDNFNNIESVSSKRLCGRCSVGHCPECGEQLLPIASEPLSAPKLVVEAKGASDVMVVCTQCGHREWQEKRGDDHTSSEESALRKDIHASMLRVGKKKADGRQPLHFDGVQ